MLSALLYLRFTSFVNWVVARARRLRQPKYLIGAIVGCAYFYFFFFRSIGGPPRVNGMRDAAAAKALEAAHATLPVEWLPVTTAVGALALLVFITFMWVVPTERAALGFTEAEVAFLFPAPITRRALVHFRLLSAQFRSLIGATVMMLFSNRWSAIGGNALTHAVGWWFIFSTLNLHFSGANFTLSRLGERSSLIWKRLLILAALVGLIAISVLRLPVATPAAAGDTLDLREMGDWMVALANTAPIYWLLWPFKLIIGPFLAIDATHFLIALAPALGVFVLHYLWVVRSAVSFEDAAVDFAQKRAARIAAWRSGRSATTASGLKSRRPPFRLADTGRPELAFLWKNLLSTWQYFNLRVLVATATFVVGVSLWVGTDNSGRAVLPVAGMLALAFAGYTLVVGPQFARQDIRSDMINADILKTYPLTGWQVIAGELLTPIVILTSVLWLALLTTALTLQPTTFNLVWLTPPLRATLTLALAAIVPPLVTLQLIVPNAAALVFPSWFQVARTRGGGPEIVGQRMIFFFAQMLTMVLSLLPPALVGALLVVLLQGVAGPVVAIVVAAVFVFVVLVGEAVLGVWLLGRRFERLDLSAELRT